MTIKNYFLFAFLLSILVLPLSGCGPSTEPVGVDDDSLEEAEQAEQTEEFISGEEGY